VRVTTTDIPGLLLIEPDVFRDPRGLFLETYHAHRYADTGIPGPFVQDNCSQSIRGTLRGLHYQEPHAQGKLVMATDGTIYDVVVDIKRGRRALDGGMEPRSRRRISAKSMCLQVVRMDSA